jgi:histidyl-tRNA synthetase
MLKTDPYKGVRDFYPEDLAIQKYIFSVWQKTVESFGYLQYDASLLEPTELYEAKTGEEIVKEQTYTFTDRGDRSVTLRPEMTPTAARMVSRRRRDLVFPLRWYSIPNLFRYERPQRGRLREHWQLNVDLFGVGSADADLEIISLAYEIMKNFGAKDNDFQIKISSRKLMNAVFNNWYQLDEEKSAALRRLIDKKSKMSADEFQQKAEEIAGKAFNFLDFSADSADYQEAMASTEIRQAKVELDEVIESLAKNGIKNVTFDSHLARGFDYYTGIIFEIFDTDPKNNRSLFGGGRYDDLLSIFGEESVPAVGFGMGDVTIQNFLESRKLLPLYQSSCEILVIALDEESKQFAKEVTEKERALGKNVALDLSYRKVSDQIKRAAKQKIGAIIVIGEKEKKKKSYEIKELK